MGDVCTPMGDSCSSRTSPSGESPGGRCSLRDPERISAAELSMDRKIGKGFTAKVFLGAFKTHQVAVKKMQDKDLAFHEAQIMAQLDHPCIVKLHGICDMSTDAGLVLEYCGGGILFDMLHVQDREIAWSQQLKICSDVANAMSHLHCMDPKIVHRDLKSPNVLLGQPLQGVDDVPTAKLCDFGLSSFLDGDMVENVGTPHWMAPECFVGGNYDEKVDVYAFGILLFEIVFLEPPYEDLAVDGIKGFVAGGGRPKPLQSVTSGCPYALRQLMEECWSQSPRRRPHFNKILMALCQLEVDDLASNSTARGRSRQGSKNSVVSVGMMF
jgi:serine/threonine protein kinase